MQNENIQTEDIEEIEQKPSEVDVKAYESIKNDMHKFKRQYQDVLSENEKLMSKLNEIEEEGLKSQNNYKDLWEKERENRAQIQEKMQAISNNLVEKEKKAAILKEARKHHFDEDWSDIIDVFDTSNILVETTSNGNIIVNGADTWVEQLKADRPKMFNKKTDPTINNTAGKFDGKDKTYSTKEVLALQKTDPAKYQDIIKNKRHLIR